MRKLHLIIAVCLYLKSKSEITNINIKIFNIEGKILSIQNVAIENQTSVAVSSLMSGIYFLKIEDENGNSAVKKFMKE